MTSTQDILQFHFSPTNLQNAAKKIVPITLSTLNDHRIDKLHKISEEVGSSSFSFSGNNLIPQVFRKFKSSIGAKSRIFERRELRTLTYSLTYSEGNLQTIFSTENELKIALEALEENWRDSYLSGLIDCLLSNWETKYQKSLEQLGQFIDKKLENYTGNRSTINSFKNNKRFFNTKNGSEILGYELALKNINLSLLPKYLGVPENWISYDYFSKSIVAYYQKNESKIIEIFDDLNNVLKSHQSGNQTGSDDIKKTSKRLISKIIIQANQQAYASLQDRLKKIAFTQIGDPGNMSNWTAFENATETEKAEIIQGRNILNVWITQQFINVFFNVCINDERRKRFWLRLASNISSFKVYGTEHTKSILKKDDRIAEYVDARFETFIGKREVSAFILYIGNHMLIEFSNDGYASIAYKVTSQWKPSLDHKLNSADDLRNGSMPMAFGSGPYSDYFNEEGRLIHKDGKSIWETKFIDWMNQIVLK
jgi:hypothetical protein